MAFQPSPYQDIRDVPLALQIWFNQLKVAISSGVGTIPWTSINKAGANLTDIPTRNHNDLTNIFGGAAADFFHWQQKDYLSFVALNKYTTNTTLSITNDGYVLVDATGGAVTITLSAASTKKRYHIKKIDSSTNAVTIARAGTDTIQGATSVALAAQYNSRTLYADGSSIWYVESST